MKLKTKELNDFLKLSSTIAVNNIIPILSYIKLEDGCLVKSNLRTFIQNRITAPSKESVLIDEKVLVAFLRECKSDEIEIKPESGNVIWLLEGKRKMKFQTAAVKDFPKFPDSEKENEVDFDSEVLEAIGCAAKNVGDIGSGEPLDFIHLNKGVVFGTDRARFYCKRIKGIPNVVLDKEAANTISQFNSVTFFQKGKYNFFEVGNTLYGFIQSEAKTPEQVHSFIPVDRPKEYMEIKVSDFVGFCDTVTSASPSKVLDCSMDGGLLEFSDSSYDIDYNVEIQTAGEFKPKITFLPRVFGSYFKSLGFDKVKLCQATLNNGALSVWNDDDNGFVGLIIGTKNANN